MGGKFSYGEAITLGVKNVVAGTSFVITSVVDARATENSLDTSDAVASSKTSSISGVSTKTSNCNIHETDIIYSNSINALDDSLC